MTKNEDFEQCVLPRHPGDPLDIHDLLAVWQHLHVPRRLIVEGRYDPSAKKQKGMKKWFNGFFSFDFFATQADLRRAYCLWSLREKSDQITDRESSRGSFSSQIELRKASQTRCLKIT